MKVTKVTPVHKSNKTKLFEEYYFNMPFRHWQIFLDMDGVICDFNGRFKEMIGRSPKEFESLYGTEAFKEKVLEKGEEFWSEMNWLPDGKLLWNYLKKYSPNILSKPLDPVKCVNGKIGWLYKHLGRNIAYNFSTEKEEYAHEYAILIDDNEDNCTAFRNAGGKAILYKDSTQAINILKKVYNLQ